VPRRGFVRCYGLFWSITEVDWFRAPGVRRFALLGRVGTRQPNFEVSDFRLQRGIYVLYDHYGPYYVGLTIKSPLGDRLKRHLMDKHADRWDRFSWFGFRPVLRGRHPDGTQGLGKVPDRLLTHSASTIQDMEALMIMSLGTQHRGNSHMEKFAAADEWTQVMRDEVHDSLAKLRPGRRERERARARRR
jgi:hypothetical protein